MGKKVKFSAEEIAEMGRLYVEEKWCIRKISQKFNSTDTTIQHSLEENGIEIKRYNKYLDEKEICRLYTEDKLNIKQISDTVGTYQVKISSILKKNGIIIENHARYFSNEDEIEVCRLYTSKEASIEKISKIFGSTSKPIKRILYKNNVEIIERPLLTIKDKEKICKLYIENNPVNDIIKIFHCGHKKIVSILKEAGIYERWFSVPKNISKRDGYKYCSICLKEKEISQFGADKKSKDGRKGQCFECVREKSKLDYLKHKEKRKLKHREYYDGNKEKLHNYSKQWYVENKPKISKHREERRFSPAPFNTYGNQLTVDEDAISDENGDLLCRCAKCEEYFYPKLTSVTQRLSSLRGNMAGESKLYCSDKCKQECDTFRSQTIPKSLRNVKKASRCNQSTNRKALLDNQEDEYGYTFCEVCGKPFPREDLIIHHNIMVGKDHTMADDMSHQIIVCAEHHSHKDC